MVTRMVPGIIGVRRKVLGVSFALVNEMGWPRPFVL